jgi:hypothetical protein
MSFLLGLDEARMTRRCWSIWKIGRGRAWDRTGEGLVVDMLSCGMYMYETERERDRESAGDLNLVRASTPHRPPLLFVPGDYRGKVLFEISVLAVHSE